MMPPDEKPQYSDREARGRYESVAKYPLARETGDHLAHHPHARQNHNVNGRVGIEPEQMLKQHGIAADVGIENTAMRDPFEAEENKRDGENRRSQDLNQAGCVMRPDKQRQAPPRQARRPHLMDGDDE